MSEKKLKLPLGFGHAKKRAEKAAADPEEMERIVSAALKKADRQRGRLSKVWDEIAGLMRLLRAWIRREYTAVPWESGVLALGAVLYFLSPIDLIPDLIPIVGYLDDVSIVAWVIQSIRGDVRDFLAWEAEHRAAGARETGVDDEREGESMEQAAGNGEEAPT